MSKEESIRVSERWDQRLTGLGDAWAKGSQQIPPLCCDRTSNVSVSHLIHLDEFVHRDFYCSSKIRCEYAYSIRQGLRVLSARRALHAGRD